MDLLIRLKDFYVNLVYILPESLTSCILRMGMLLTLTIIFLILSWLYLPGRSTFSQTCIAFIVLTISLHIPVEELREGGEGFLAFMVSLAFLCTLFLPSVIPFWLTPKLINQVRIRRIIKYFIWGILLVQTIVR